MTLITTMVRVCSSQEEMKACVQSRSHPLLETRFLVGVTLDDS